MPSLSTELDEDSRRTLTASGSLILKDVNFGDTAIYQCKASNTHGTILTNTNVYVIGVCCFLFSWGCSSVASTSAWLTDFSLRVFVFRAARPDPQRGRQRVHFRGRPEGLAGVRDLRLSQAQSRVVRRRPTPLLPSPVTRLQALGPASRVFFVALCVPAWRPCSASDRASDASHVCVGAALCAHKLAAKCFYIWAVIVNVAGVAASSPRCRWHVNSAQLQIKGLFLQEQLLCKLLLRCGRAGGWTDGWVGEEGCGFVCLGGVGGFSSSSCCVSPKTKPG